jgi:threonylcarbamoyladenosine tRNA methylthiotransferase CDKAL1
MKLSKKVFLITNGCPENRIDLARMQEFLKGNGWTVTSTIEDADIIFFNTCGLTHYNQEISIKIINQLKDRKKPSAELIVCGCLPKINKDCLREVYQGFTFGSDEIERLTEIIETKTSPQDTYANYLFPFTEDISRFRQYIPHFRKLLSFMAIKERLTIGYYERLCQAINVFHPYSFCIKVSTGCLGACAFCAVKLSRGTVKSKPIHKVVAEFEEGLAKGYTEFALIGTDLGSYGRDQGTTLVALLRELVTRKGDYQIRLRNIQPRFLLEMMPGLRNLFQSGKISYLSSAAESGNNRILKLMNRGYRVEDFKEAILTINREFPKIQLRTQLMAGFPSETEDEFQDTVRLLDEVSFDFVETYMFQPRPNTKAANMEDQIPEKVARRRYHKLFMKSLFNEKERKNKALKEYKENLKKWGSPPNMIKKGN